MSKSVYKIYVRYTTSRSIDIKREHSKDGQVAICRRADASFFKIGKRFVLADTKKMFRDLNIKGKDALLLQVCFDSKKGKFYVKKVGEERIYLEDAKVKYQNVNRFCEVADRFSSSKKVKGLDLLREELKGHKYVQEKDDLFEIKISTGSGGSRIQHAIAKVKAAHKKMRGGSGEGPAHKALKKFVEGHPEKLGVSDAALVETEFLLPSGDRVDVAFDDEKQLVLAEVKSATSVDADVERGLYQCVKYEAVAKKWLKAERISQSVRVVLVLESALPKDLQPLKDSLGIEVYENIKPGS